uniref:N-terminal methionine N(alpha)-acetyltransferase NatE n=1 Tax=Panagrolaimus superbus TaxID=310955 RepID=A0A914YHA9_9BILA
MASTSALLVKQELKDEIAEILKGLSLNDPASKTNEEASDESSSMYGSSRFDEMGNFKFGKKAPKYIGKCFLQIGEVTQHNIAQLKEINKQVLPVVYNERFYNEVMNAGEFAKLAYFNDSVVGAVCCRPEVKENRKRLYIMMIGTLAPYRRYGVGTMLISHVLALCEKDTNIESVYLHVQSSNEAAMEFYKKFGFEVVDNVKNYYKRIEPNDAYLLEKAVNNGTKSAKKENTGNCVDFE